MSKAIENPKSEVMLPVLRFQKYPLFDYPSSCSSDLCKHQEQARKVFEIIRNEASRTLLLDSRPDSYIEIRAKKLLEANCSKLFPRVEIEGTTN